MKNLHIKNNYNIWSTKTMREVINEECANQYHTSSADKALNRSYKGMYIEWYLHNIGY